VAKRKAVRKSSSVRKAKRTRKGAYARKTGPARARRTVSRAPRATRAKGRTAKGAQPPPERDARFEVMKRFIRTHSDDYLKDPNISSVGIGYKQVEGVRTKTLAVQFCVDRKARPEALEAVTAKPIPQTIEFEGVAIPTDVVQRSFRPSYRIVTLEEIEKDERKQRLETIVPGISIGHVRSSAGTLGALVEDKRTGETVILSNWHVFHTPVGQIGDDIVQPGPFDDDRVDRNVIGKLRRSHLGPAGDCAICSVESRNVDPTILGLKTGVGRIGAAELDDRVVKSGRTTAVTHGVVTRVETMTKMDYGAGVRATVGGFEIGVDTNRKPDGGEISKGGDSGSVWMAFEGGKATDVMLGLHFAGEDAESDAEFALACEADAVFEKLEIAPLRDGVGATAAQAPAAAAVFEDEHPEFRTGFDRGFLSFAFPDVRFTDAISPDIAQLSGAREIRYCHFSVWLSKSRRFPRVVGWNIDGTRIKRVSRKGIPFVKDERGTLENFQIGDELYKNNPLDRGHLARRADLCWGVTAEAKQANRDSFFFTNITPQHQRFNQSLRRGLWGRLEDAIFEDVDVENLRVSLLGGPILRADDPFFLDVRIPTEFWKLVAYTDVADGADKVRAFILTQRNLLDDLVEPEALELDEFHVFQVPLERIERENALRFSAAFKALDTMPAAPEALGRPNVRLVTSQQDLFA
jgi:endonuclease G